MDTLEATTLLPDGSIIVPSSLKCPVLCLLSFLDYLDMPAGVDVIGRDITQPFVIAPWRYAMM